MIGDNGAALGTFNGQTQNKDVPFSLTDEQIKRIRFIKCSVIAENP